MEVWQATPVRRQPPRRTRRRTCSLRSSRSAAPVLCSAARRGCRARWHLRLQMKRQEQQQQHPSRLATARAWLSLALEAAWRLLRVAATCTFRTLSAKGGSHTCRPRTPKRRSSRAHGRPDKRSVGAGVEKKTKQFSLPEALISNAPLLDHSRSSAPSPFSLFSLGLAFASHFCRATFRFPVVSPPLPPLPFERAGMRER